ncbi:MAG: hypothetical protein Q9219_001844 [cf. Caloplaca sp. 3 TL-2023]
MDDIDDRPLAVRRKRRTSSALVNPEAHDATSQVPGEDKNTQAAACDPPKTPENRKKRVRYSDPVEVIGSSSTGLTPALNRSKLLPAESIKSAKKRQSLPTKLQASTASPASPQFPNVDAMKVVHFAPMRQAIDLRMMRRLRRNHLGEEINEIHAEQKSNRKLQHEIENLRYQLAQAKNNTETTTEHTARVTELENELSDLKQELREQSSAADSTSTRYVSEDHASAGTDLADVVALSNEQTFYLQDEHVTVTDVNQVGTINNAVEASIQVDLPSPTLSDLCRSVRLSFEYLFPGETALGLEVPDPQSLLEAMITRAKALKAEIAQIEQKVAVSETSKSNMVRHFNNAVAQLEQIRAQIQALQEQLADEKARANSSELEVATLEARLENTVEKCNDAEKKRNENQRSLDRIRPALDYYQKECDQLTVTIMDFEVSHQITLENLRAELTEDKDGELACQEVLFGETKSDLEAQVAAETLGRRKAEESAVERHGQIKELENRQQELQSAVHEKQSIIRDLESELETTKSSQEKEVGQLNVRIGGLVSQVSSTKIELADLQAEATRLASLLELEKAAGLQAVYSMQSEMEKCSHNVDTVRKGHVEGVKQRGEQVAQSFGLMTPVVPGGRFRDAEADEKVEGHVEFVRGKKRTQRPDSGVEIWDRITEEDEDEEMEGDAVIDA